MFDQFMKGFEAYKMPQFDAGKVITQQQKSMQEMTGLMQEMGQSAQAIAQKATEFAQSNVQESIKASQDIFTTTTPDQNLAKQGEFIKKTVANCTKQAKELNKLSTETQFKVVENFNKRVAESFSNAA